MELVWRDVYERAVELFGGQRPRAQLEADIVERFEEAPTSVVDAIEKLGERFASGRVHSPWPLVLRELDDSPRRDEIRASDESDRARAVHLAERYIATAGMFMPQDEILSELFGARGRLKPWPELQAHVLEVWQARQLDAAQVERERLERAERWKAMHRLGSERTSVDVDAQPQHPSQTSAALTAVSADTDADIDWAALAVTAQ